ncbi:MAG: hypothetical protein IPP36_10240 [Nitrosomonadales bacterium]|nr:hypothetical protein [Nitrosomonadales bacterium]
MSYVNARDELRRIDRLVEFDDEVWVLDYKTGAPSDFMSHKCTDAGISCRDAGCICWKNSSLRIAVFGGDVMRNQHTNDKIVMVLKRNLI